jgi:hypothetical protein
MTEKRMWCSVLGFFERIKAWFTRKLIISSQSSPTHGSIDSSLSENDTLSEGQLLVQEYTHLESERLRLRQEITIVDARHSSGEITAANRDQAYRMRLARAGRISMRQIEIRSRLLKMGHPIPDEWSTRQILR